MTMFIPICFRLILSAPFFFCLTSNCWNAIGLSPEFSSFFGSVFFPNMMSSSTGWEAHMYVSPGYTYTFNSVVYNPMLIVHDSSATMCPSQKLTGSPQSALHLPSPPYKKAFPFTFLLIKTIEKQTCESLDYYSVLHSTSRNITYVFYNQNLSQICSLLSLSHHPIQIST